MLKILQDVHPRRDGLQEAEVCCKFNRSADTGTDVLLIPKALEEQERAQARKGEDEEERSSSDNAKVYYAVTPSGRRQVIDEYRSLVLAKFRARQTSFRCSPADGGRVASECTFQR